MENGRMTSPEKVQALIGSAMADRNPDPDTAVWYQLADIALPMIGPRLPKDPAQLDALLAKGVKLLASLRSDDAPTVDAVPIPMQQLLGTGEATPAP